MPGLKIGRRFAIVDRIDVPVQLGIGTLTLYVNRRSLGEEFYRHFPEQNGHGEPPPLSREQVRGQILAVTVGWDALDEENGQPLELTDHALRRFDIRDLSEIYQSVMGALSPNVTAGSN